jgi:tetratricopeptide (TPR) repeat protein
VYDSAEMVEKDVMHDARVRVAQGDYHGAIEAFKEAAKAEPLNRLPWVEISKIYKDHLEDPQAAIQTIRYALESQEWEVNDAAYFLFRLAELYDEVAGDRASAIAIMQQVVEQFPRTRHSANANTKLHEWGADQPQEQVVVPLPAAPPPTPPPPSELRTRYEVPGAGDNDSGRGV